MIDLSKLKEDRDVVEPFIERTLARVRERHPDVTLDDITVLIEVRVLGVPAIDPLGEAAVRFRRMLSDMDKEGIVL